MYGRVHTKSSDIQNPCYLNLSNILRLEQKLYCIFVVFYILIFVNLLYISTFFFLMYIEDFASLALRKYS